MLKKAFNTSGLGLQAKITIVVIIASIVTLSVSTFMEISFDKKRALEQMEDSAVILTRSLERSISTNNIFNNPAELQKLILEYNKIEGVTEVYVIDNNYKILANPNPEKIGTYYRNKDAREAIQFNRLSTEFKEEDDKDLKDEKKEEGEVYDVVTPLLNGNKVIGAVEVELSMDSVNAALDYSYLRGTLVIIFDLAAIGVITTLLLLRVVIRPVQNLAAVTTEISTGNFNIAIEDSETKDEIAELTKAFQKMVNSLKELRIRDQSSNPLTGLPGNIVIQEDITKRIAEGQNFGALYLDLDNFKAFNDYYGFSHGDRAIKYMAAVIQWAVAEFGTPNDLIGHLGGDDFIVVTTAEDKELLAAQIIEAFDSAVKSVYKKADYQRGYIETVDRLGNQCRFPLMSISIAVVDNSFTKVRDYLELSETAARLKHLAKNKKGSNFVSDKNDK